MTYFEYADRKPRVELETVEFSAEPEIVDVSGIVVEEIEHPSDREHRRWQRMIRRAEAEAEAAALQRAYELRL